jgi:hypothetical protein
MATRPVLVDRFETTPKRVELNKAIPFRVHCETAGHRFVIAKPAEMAPHVTAATCKRYPGVLKNLTWCLRPSFGKPCSGERRSASGRFPFAISA